ncbi:serine/threonine-protein phosphatase [Streptomyces sp. SL13]|uniref:Serine/threonine-protein phosphatase n=1 Tax=Streptantibioticus silvisoli TaxID=2705255 RepID=A0AA90H6V2_9ACTN|nr:ATP-binding SpoIIE family protein phosphatase [Streptantibioticus silvisoli]MDI5971567.1 serine/threonine-protein phosphatase [Streptantibioticus silvisoli]
MTDRDGVLSATAARVLSDLGASAVTIYLYDDPSRQLVASVAAVTPLGTGSVERVPVDDFAYASATSYQTGGIVTAHSVQELGNHPETAVFAPFPFTVTSVPLGPRERPLGAMSTYWPQMFRKLTDDERGYLRKAAATTGQELERLASVGVSMTPPVVPHVIASDAGEATGLTTGLSGTRQGDRTARTTPLIYHLHKLANALIGTVRTEDAADLALERVIEGFHARAMAITLTEGDRLRVIGARGCSRAFLRELNGRPLGQPSLETDAVTQMRQIVQRPDLDEDTDDGADADDADDADADARADADADDAAADARADGADAVRPADALRSAAAVRPADAHDDGTGSACVWAVLPLLAGGHAIGSCSIGFSQERTGVVNEHSVLIALATLLGQTFERTRLYDSRHSLAQKLQQALLPRMLPQMAGVLTTTRYVPTSGGIELGGDWYDLINLPDGRIAAVIGDVQGHNISAAVVMGQLRSAVRAYATEGHDPATVAGRTNRLLVELDTDRFATCCLVWLDPDTGIAEIVSAGHHQPLIRFPDGRYHRDGLEVGIPLGIEPEADYRATRIRLDPGTLLTLYTDGLVGTDGRPDDETVRLALEDALTGAGGELETIGDRMISGISERPARADDSALLLMRYEGASAQAQLHVRRLSIHRRDLQGVRRARQFLREWLHSVELTDLTQDAELLASEVVTNALVHGDSDVDIHVRRYPERVRIEVRDSDPHLALPAAALAEDEAEGGRGLIIVSAMASAWGNSPSGRGKTVWFELPTPDGDEPRTPPPDGRTPDGRPPEDRPPEDRPPEDLVADGRPVDV